MQIVAADPQPTLEFDVTGGDGRTRRLTVFTGTVDVVPPDTGRRFRVVASDPNGVPVAFVVPGAIALPVAGAVVVAEAWIARMPISTGADNTFRYGIVGARGQLVPAEDQPGLGWPSLQALAFGGDLTVTIAYRLTVQSER